MRGPSSLIHSASGLWSMRPCPNGHEKGRETDIVGETEAARVCVRVSSRPGTEPAQAAQCDTEF